MILFTFKSLGSNINRSIEVRINVFDKIKDSKTFNEVLSTRNSAKNLEGINVSIVKIAKK
jgi:hypothetical protein